MKTADGFVQGGGREIGQLVLEPAKGHAALTQILHGFGLVQAKAVRNKLIQPPKLAVAGQVVQLPAARGNQGEHVARITVLLAKETGDRDHVAHQRLPILKYVTVELLQDVSVRLVR